jgi:hypothetical protein
LQRRDDEKVELKNFASKFFLKFTKTIVFYLKFTCYLFRYCKNLRRDDEKAELKSFASKRKQDCLGRGSVQTVPQPNIKCSKVWILFMFGFFLNQIGTVLCSTVFGSSSIWTCWILNICFDFFNSNNYSKFDTSKSISHQGYKTPILVESATFAIRIIVTMRKAFWKHYSWRIPKWSAFYDQKSRLVWPVKLMSAEFFTNVLNKNSDKQKKFLFYLKGVANTNWLWVEPILLTFS